MSTARRPGYFDTDDNLALVEKYDPEGICIFSDGWVPLLDRLSDLGECEFLSDDVRNDLRVAVAYLARCMFPPTD